MYRILTSRSQTTQIAKTSVFLRMHSRRHDILHALVCSFVASLILGSNACVIVPVRLPTKTQDISGTVQKLDFTFLKAGSTTRDAVNKNLVPIDTHAGQANFFWGRWESSKWGYGAFGGVEYPTVAGGRTWDARNIFINFDPKGIVTTWKVIDDKKLFYQLDLLDTERSSVDAPAPLVSEIELRNWSQPDEIRTANLTLSQEFLECEDVKVSRSNIRKITTAGEDAQHPSAAHIWVTIHLSTRTSGKKGVKSLTVGLDPPTLLSLLRYIKQTKSAQSSRTL
jgi:hypothetical protein